MICFLPFVINWTWNSVIFYWLCWINRSDLTGSGSLNLFVDKIINYIKVTTKLGYIVRRNIDLNVFLSKLIFVISSCWCWFFKILIGFLMDFDFLKLSLNIYQQILKIVKIITTLYALKNKLKPSGFFWKHFLDRNIT